MEIVKGATSHLSISMCEQRETGKIQRNNLPSRELRAVFKGYNVFGVFDMRASDASECQKSLSEKQP